MYFEKGYPSCNTIKQKVSEGYLYKGYLSTSAWMFFKNKSNIDNQK